MNLRSSFLGFRSRLPLAAGCAVALWVAEAPAQIQPPDAKDTQGNRAQYLAPTTTPASPRPSTSEVGPDPVAAVQRKLDAIIIPRLELHDASLTDAIEQLRQESARLDTDADPANRGVNIFLKRQAGTNAASARITLALTDTSLSGVLKHVADQVGMKVKVEAYAASLVPLSESTDPMFTVEYRVSPAAVGLASEPDPTPGSTGPPFNMSVTRGEVKDWLKSKGIAFPPGASAAYLWTTHKLIVRNTRDNCDRIKTLVGSSPLTP